MRSPRFLLPFLLVFGHSAAAEAFVSTAVGGRPGELDVNAQVTAERGKIEPNENQKSFMKAKDFYEYKLGVGYTWGHAGPFQFISTRLEATYYQSPTEVNDPAEWQVNPAGSSTPAGLVPECSNGARYLGGGVCEFYDDDTGTLVSATVSTALVHDPKFAFGVYLRGTVPFKMNLEKFANPRLDYIAGGWQMGVELQDWLGFESTLYLGSGTRPFSKEQNGAVAVGNLLHFKAERWLLPWKAGVKVGPYVEGDIHERFDPRYDAAYSAQEPPQPGVTTPVREKDRIRAARFAVAFLPYFLVTKNLSVELGYVQKFFGYDARATQAYFVGLRGLIEL
ncbi:MAG TPA: hypothetical protein PKA88_06540 [Polyangiaceae bacterium]|nr:hypothetical protein [Polyangiaceae bacterium]